MAASALFAFVVEQPMSSRSHARRRAVPRRSSELRQCDRTGGTTRAARGAGSLTSAYSGWEREAAHGPWDQPGWASQYSSGRRRSPGPIGGVGAGAAASCILRRVSSARACFSVGNRHSAQRRFAILVLGRIRTNGEHRAVESTVSTLSTRMNVRTLQERLPICYNA